MLQMTAVVELKVALGIQTVVSLGKPVVAEAIVGFHIQVFLEILVVAIVEVGVEVDIGIVDVVGATVVEDISEQEEAHYSSQQLEFVEWSL